MGICCHRKGMALFTAAAIMVGLGCSTVGSGSGTGGADAPPAGTGGVIVPHGGTGGMIVVHDGTGGMIVVHDGTGGVIVVHDGTGGVIVPHDGTGGVIARNGCPTTAPANGSPCDGNDPWCFYQDCAGAGRTLATCGGGVWSTSVAACDATTCISGLPGTSCPGTQICHIHQGGALYSSCDSSPCGTGPVSPCGCLGEVCTMPGQVGCTWNASLSAGITEYCITCLSGPSCI